MGFRENQIKVGQARQLEGYEGRLRDQTAEIIIPRSAVGGAANDIGFKLQSDGTYEAIISQYDRGNGSSSKHGSHSQGIRGYGDQWMKKLNQRYSYNKLKEQVSDQGFFIEEEREENGEIFIEISAGGFGS
jgi:hypothetical protein